MEEETEEAAWYNGSPYAEQCRNAGGVSSSRRAPIEQTEQPMNRVRLERGGAVVKTGEWALIRFFAWRSS